MGFAGAATEAFLAGIAKKKEAVAGAEDGSAFVESAAEAEERDEGDVCVPESKE